MSESSLKRISSDVGEKADALATVDPTVSVESAPDRMVRDDSPVLSGPIKSEEPSYQPKTNGTVKAKPKFKRPNSMNLSISLPKSPSVGASQPGNQSSPQPMDLGGLPNQSDALSANPRLTAANRSVEIPNTNNPMTASYNGAPWGEIEEMELGRGGNGRTIGTMPPTKILDHLWIGSAKDSKDLSTLRRLGVTYVLNVARGCANTFPALFTYKNVDMSDDVQEDALRHFEESFKFIDLAKQDTSAVLVHCQKGVSRSATICLAYLMREKQWGLRQAYDHLKKLRPTICPNLGFMVQLSDFEQQSSGKMTIFDEPETDRSDRPTSRASDASNHSRTSRTSNKDSHLVPAEDLDNRWPQTPPRSPTLPLSHRSGSVNQGISSSPSPPLQTPGVRSGPLAFPSSSTNGSVNSPLAHVTPPPEEENGRPTIFVETKTVTFATNETNSKHRRLSPQVAEEDAELVKSYSSLSMSELDIETPKTGHTPKSIDFSLSGMELTSPGVLPSPTKSHEGREPSFEEGSSSLAAGQNMSEEPLRRSPPITLVDHHSREDDDEIRADARRRSHKQKSRLFCGLLCTKTG